MQTLTPRLFRELAACEAPLCVSLYMEMSAGGGDHDQIRIALKNAKAEATEVIAQLEAGVEPDAVSSVKERIALLGYGDVAGGHDRRVAVFIAPDMTHVVDARFDDIGVRVGTYFRIAPLLGHLTQTPAHAVLVVSSEQASLYLATGGALEEQQVPDMPSALSDISQFTDQQEKGNIHGREDSGIPASYKGGPASPSGPAGPAGVPHHSMGGHDWREDHEQDMRGYANGVINAVQNHLSGTNLPLVIVADERLYGMLHASTDYPFLVSGGVTQHPGSLDEKDLAAAASACLDDAVEQRLDEAWDKVAMSLGRDDHEASTDPLEIVTAAAAGRVAHLFVKNDARVPGHFDPEAQTAEAAADGPEDLIDRAIIYTLRNGGDVFALENDGNPATDIAASFRYPA
ncbi:hypothetical protein [Yoonia sp.]|uniref:baeRF3 domain-containing protein n=1 Tax=Yoonia sp. TaxID=2212373 RepID=UPI003919EAC3